MAVYRPDGMSSAGLLALLAVAVTAEVRGRDRRESRSPLPWREQALCLLGSRTVSQGWQRAQPDPSAAEEPRGILIMDPGITT